MFKDIINIPKETMFRKITEKYILKCEFKNQNISKRILSYKELNPDPKTLSHQRISTKN